MVFPLLNNYLLIYGHFFYEIKVDSQRKGFAGKGGFTSTQGNCATKTTITRIDATSRTNITGDEIYGPHYRKGLEFIISKSISNTGSLLYKVKWKDGSTTTVTPNSLRPQYYSTVEAFEYAQFQEDESDAKDSPTETEDMLRPRTNRKTRSMGMTKQLRSSRISPSKDMIDIDDALIAAELADDSTQSEDMPTRRRRRTKKTQDRTLSESPSVEARRQPQRRSTTHRAIQCRRLSA
ncbi:unnamed protein product [Absidia cylindrospora]